ncbi:MAG TPA: pyridoxal-dependent decarboxylase [Gaiellaceae bacterium]
MFQNDERLTELVLEHCRRRLALAELPIGFGGTRPPDADALDGLLCEEGNDASHVLDVFVNELSSSVLASDSARYLAFIPAAPTKASLLFDMIVSCSSFPGTSWFEAAGAVMAENQALRLLADLAGLPPEAGGCFVSGGSGANLSGLVVARETQARRRGSDPRARARVAISAEAHASVGLVLRVIGVETLEIPTEDHRLTGHGLRAALDADPQADDVFAVVATAGTTNAGIIDDLAGVADVAGERDLWLHVDGAYGGAALLAPSARDRFRGIERADSYVVDPHKWLFAPYDCAAVLYREPELAKMVLAQHASYLDVFHTDADDEWNPGDYAFHLTRRTRGLPFWFSLAVHGIGAYREAVEKVLATTRACAGLIERAPQLELLRDPELSVVLFRRNGWGEDDYGAWSSRLLAEQRALVTPTRWEGEPVARLAFLHPETTVALVEEILAATA